MLNDIVEFAGGTGRAAAPLVGVSEVTLSNWRKGKGFAGPSYRLVWVTWIILLHPERLQTAFDLATWGRFRVERPASSCGSDTPTGGS